MQSFALQKNIVLILETIAIPEINSGISHIFVMSWKKNEQKKIEDNKPPTCSLRPVILNNARPSCITAAAGTEFAGTSF